MIARKTPADDIYATRVSCIYLFQSIQTIFISSLEAANDRFFHTQKHLLQFYAIAIKENKCITYILVFLIKMYMLESLEMMSQKEKDVKILCGKIWIWEKAKELIKNVGVESGVMPDDS